ncbi:MAG: tetratricopeptide repeat protein [bacterium]
MRTRELKRWWKTVLVIGVIAFSLPVNGWASSLSKAESLYQAGNYSGAEKLLDKIISKDQGFLAAHRMLVKCYIRDGKFDGAVTKYTGLMIKEPDNPLYKYITAYLYDLKGYDKFIAFSNERRAMLGYKNTLKLDPTFPFVNYNIGLLLYKKGDYLKAIEALKKEIANNRKNEKAYYYLAMSYYQDRRFNKAINTALDLLKIYPDSLRANKVIGKAYYALGNRTKALAAWKKSMKFEKADKLAGVHNMNGLVFRSMKLYNSAAKEFRLGIRQNPKNARLHSNLAFTYYQKVTGKTFGDHPEKWLYEAIKEYKKAITYNPSPDSYLKLSRSYSRLGLRDDWVKTLEKYVKLYPKDLRAYNELGNAYKMVGNYKSAVAILKKGIDLDKKNAETYRNLGYVYYYKGFQQRALESWQKSIKLYPNQPVLKERMSTGFSKR